MKKTLITSLLALGLASAVSAQTIVDAETTGYRITSSGASAKDNTDNYFIGNFSDAGNSTAFNFQLPDLGGQAIDTVQLETFFQKYNDGVAADTDTALFVKTSNTAIRTNADYIAPSNGFGTTPSGWTEIQLDFIPANSGKSEFDSLTLSSTGQSNLKTFLDAYYSGTPAGGDYLVAGFAMDTNGETLAKFSFTGIYLSSDGDTTGDLSNLTITAIPEPSTFALLAGALGLGLVISRRRR